MMQSLKGELLLVLVTLSAALGWLLSQQALLSFSPFWFLAIRFLLAGAILAVFAKGTLAQLSLDHWRVCIRLGALMGCAMLIWVMGLFHSQHLGESAFIASLAVIFVPLVGRIIFGTKISSSLFAPLLLAIFGMAVLMLSNGFHVERSQLYILTAALFFAAHFVITSHVVQRIAPLAITTIQMTMVGLVALIAALWREPLELDVGFVAWQWLFWSVLIASLLRFALQTYAMRMTSANNAGMILVLEPVWTVMIAGAYLNESLAFNQWVGCALIFGSIILYQYLRFREVNATLHP